MKPVLRDPQTGRILNSVEVVDADSGAELGSIDGPAAVEGLRCNNLTLDTDLYELTMAAGYRVLGKCGQRACFDLYYRNNPDDGAFCVFAGLESVIDYVNNIRLYPDDADYLRSLDVFPPDAVDELVEGVKFTGDIWSVPEGAVVFPNEPIMRVTGPIAEAQILETTLLALVGHQTLIATKAARMCISSRGAPVIDFGARRAHGVQAARLGARAAYIGGCEGTSNVRAGRLHGIPLRGTHAHSWVESFETERESFEGFAEVFPNNCVLLVDTYHTAEGVAEAIRVGLEMKRKGGSLFGIRIDSGDLAYHSKAARHMLNEAGLYDVKILASSDLDEWIIQSLRDQGAPVDIWCVGTRLITSYNTPALGMVYKLMAADHADGQLTPKIKISANPQKLTNPGVKKILRFFNGHGRMIGDLLAYEDEPLPNNEPVVAHHPLYDYMRKTYRPPYGVEEILHPVFVDGRQVYEKPSLREVRAYAAEQIERLEPEYKRLSNPHIYKVSLSDKLHRLKKELLSYHLSKLNGAKS